MNRNIQIAPAGVILKMRIQLRGASGRGARRIPAVRLPRASFIICIYTGETRRISKETSMGRRHAASDVSYPRWIWLAAAATVALLIVGGAFLLRAVIFPGSSGEGGPSAGNGGTPSEGESLA